MATQTLLLCNVKVAD